MYFGNHTKNIYYAYQECAYNNNYNVIEKSAFCMCFAARNLLESYIQYYTCNHK